MAFQLTTEATLASVVKSICARASYPIPNDPGSSQDPKIKQMIAAANAASVELFSIYEWSELIVEGQIDVFYDVPEQKEKGFALPDDFFRFIDQTQWNGAMRFPAVGPVSPQGWMTYMVFPISANFTLTWQIREGKIWFLNAPPSPGQTFRFMYLSRALVRDADDPTLYKNVASKNGDTFVLDGILMTLMTRIKWLEAKGFDSGAAVRDFMLAFDSRVGAQKGSNILNMAGGPHDYPYIGIGNLPEASLYGMRQ